MDWRHGPKAKEEKNMNTLMLDENVVEITADEIANNKMEMGLALLHTAIAQIDHGYTDAAADTIRLAISMIDGTAL
jgi:hypothetical protein